MCMKIELYIEMEIGMKMKIEIEMQQMEMLHMPPLGAALLLLIHMCFSVSFFFANFHGLTTESQCSMYS